MDTDSDRQAAHLRQSAFICGFVLVFLCVSVSLWQIEDMKDTITVYEKPTCTKCREMDRFLRESGVDFSKINYYLEPLSEQKLRELIKKMGITPRELLRTSESIYRELGLSKKDLSDDEIISLMVKHPDLMQRPIVERGDRAVLGRPTENVKPLLK
jgi:arsenate reductase (glutaredoxin)